MIDLKERTVCFTGHRKIPPKQKATIARRLKNEIIKLVEKNYRYFGAGGALGFDTLAAQTVLELKTEHPDVKLILVLPCLSQTRGWSARDIEIYEEIRSKADQVIYTSQEYTRGCMHKRNRHLVDNSSVCICYLTESTGGTAYTVNYAKERGLMTINVAEK